MHTVCGQIQVRALPVGLHWHVDAVQALRLPSICGRFKCVCCL